MGERSRVEKCIVLVDCEQCGEGSDFIIKRYTQLISRLLCSLTCLGHYSKPKLWFGFGFYNTCLPPSLGEHVELKEFSSHLLSQFVEKLKKKLEEDDLYKKARGKRKVVIPQEYLKQAQIERLHVALGQIIHSPILENSFLLSPMKSACSKSQCLEQKHIILITRIPHDEVLFCEKFLNEVSLPTKGKLAQLLLGSKGLKHVKAANIQIMLVNSSDYLLESCSPVYELIQSTLKLIGGCFLNHHLISATSPQLEPFSNDIRNEDIQGEHCLPFPQCSITSTISQEVNFNPICVQLRCKGAPQSDPIRMECTLVGSPHVPVPFCEKTVSLLGLSMIHLSNLRPSYYTGDVLMCTPSADYITQYTSLARRLWRSEACLLAVVDGTTSSVFHGVFRALSEHVLTLSMLNERPSRDLISRLQPIRRRRRSKQLSADCNGESTLGTSLENRLTEPWYVGDAETLTHFTRLFSEQSTNSTAKSAAPCQLRSAFIQHLRNVQRIVAQSAAPSARPRPMIRQRSSDSNSSRRGGGAGSSLLRRTCRSAQLLQLSQRLRQSSECSEVLSRNNSNASHTLSTADNNDDTPDLSSKDALLRHILSLRDQAAQSQDKLVDILSCCKRIVSATSAYIGEKRAETTTGEMLKEASILLDDDPMKSDKDMNSQQLLATCRIQCLLLLELATQQVDKLPDIKDKIIEKLVMYLRYISFSGSTGAMTDFLKTCILESYSLNLPSLLCEIYEELLLPLPPQLDQEKTAPPSVVPLASVMPPSNTSSVNSVGSALPSSVSSATLKTKRMVRSSSRVNLSQVRCIAVPRQPSNLIHSNKVFQKLENRLTFSNNGVSNTAEEADAPAYTTPKKVKSGRVLKTRRVAETPHRRQGSRLLRRSLPHLSETVVHESPHKPDDGEFILSSPKTQPLTRTRSVLNKAQTFYGAGNEASKLSQSMIEKPTFSPLKRRSSILTPPRKTRLALFRNMLTSPPANENVISPLHSQHIGVKKLLFGSPTLDKAKVELDSKASPLRRSERLHPGLKAAKALFTSPCKSATAAHSSEQTLATQVFDTRLVKSQNENVNRRDAVTSIGETRKRRSETILISPGIPNSSATPAMMHSTTPKKSSTHKPRRLILNTPDKQSPPKSDSTCNRSPVTFSIDDGSSDQSPSPIFSSPEQHKTPVKQPVGSAPILKTTPTKYNSPRPKTPSKVRFNDDSSKTTTKSNLEAVERINDLKTPGADDKCLSTSSSTHRSKLEQGSSRNDSVRSSIKQSKVSSCSPRRSPRKVHAAACTLLIKSNQTNGKSLLPEPEEIFSAESEFKKHLSRSSCSSGGSATKRFVSDEGVPSSLPLPCIAAGDVTNASESLFSNTSTLQDSNSKDARPESDGKRKYCLRSSGSTTSVEPEVTVRRMKRTNQLNSSRHQSPNQTPKHFKALLTSQIVTPSPPKSKRKASLRRK